MPATERQELKLWNPPLRDRSEHWLDIEYRACRAAYVPWLLKKEAWSYRWVDVTLHNPGPEAVQLPVGEQAVLVDGVGYAYRDRMPVRTARKIAPGGSRKVRYLFRVPSETTIAKIRLNEVQGTRQSETGYITMHFPKPKEVVAPSRT